MGVPTPQFSASATGRLVAYQGAMLVQVDAATARSVIGAQADLGYTPVNKAGDSGLGNMSMNGITSVTGNITLNGWSGITEQGVVFFGATGTRYLHYDGSIYNLNGAHVYSAAGRLWGSSDFNYTPANKAGDTFTGNVAVSSANPSFEVVGSFPAVIIHHSGVFRWGIGTANGLAELVWYNANSPASQPMRLSSGGNLTILGTIAKGGGTFLIDHPVDPANRDLAHGFVEAPRYDLIYRGVVSLVAGTATVDIDAESNMTTGTFAALTTNAVVMSLHNQNGFARVKSSPISGSLFEITCEDTASTDAVAWLVIAERNDFFVKRLDENCDADGRFIPDREKPDYQEPTP